MMRQESEKHAETWVFTKNGKPIYIRPLRPTDNVLIDDLFRSLSPRSIFFRFLRHWKTVPPELTEFLMKIDSKLNVAMVALEKRQSGERVLGLCGILRKPGSEKGEFAVVVRDEWQGIGVGAKLIEASLPMARDLGMKELWGLVSPENTVMIETARKLKFTVGRDRESGFYEMEMHFGGTKTFRFHVSANFSEECYERS